MSTYISTQNNSKLSSVEFHEDGGKQLAFVHLRDSTQLNTVKSWLSAPALGLSVLSETNHNNKPIVVIRGEKPAAEILKALAQHGEELQPPAPEKKKFNPWAWRATTSIAGQSLQIASSFTTFSEKGKGLADKVSVFSFAALNLIANFINYIYGAQEKNDPNHLRFLKEQFNTQLQPYVAANATLPSPDKNPLEEHGRTKNKELGFWDKYSVTLGEIGLRTLGSLSLVFPVTQLFEKEFKQASSVGGKYKAALNTNPFTIKVGILMLTGKFISLLAKEPDPYNPEPPSLFDKFREKVAFKLSSGVEGFAAGVMTYDRLRHNRSKWGQTAIDNGATPSILKHSDLAGAAGNIIFMGGYGIRFTAPYGSREVNMRELYAHLVDGLAKVEPEKLPQLVLDTAIGLHEHFKDKPANKKNPLDLPSIYKRLVNELATDHQIHIDTPATATPSVSVAATKQLSPSPQPSITGTKTLAPAAIGHSVAMESSSRAH